MSPLLAALGATALLLAPTSLTAQEGVCANAAVLEASASISRQTLCALVDEAAATRTDALYVSQDGRTLLDWRPEAAPPRSSACAWPSRSPSPRPAT